MTYLACVAYNDKCYLTAYSDYPADPKTQFDPKATISWVLKLPSRVPISLVKDRLRAFDIATTPGSLVREGQHFCVCFGDPRRLFEIALGYKNPPGYEEAQYFGQ